MASVGQKAWASALARGWLSPGWLFEVQVLMLDRRPERQAWDQSARLLA
jgi:hypothetical protein